MEIHQIIICVCVREREKDEENNDSSDLWKFIASPQLCLTVILDSIYTPNIIPKKMYKR